MFFDYFYKFWPEPEIVKCVIWVWMVFVLIERKQVSGLDLRLVGLRHGFETTSYVGNTMAHREHNFLTISCIITVPRVIFSTEIFSSMP